MTFETTNSSMVMKTVCIIVLMAIQGSFAVPEMKMAWSLDVDENQSDKTFEITTSNSKATHCINTCKTSSDCILINFNIRQKICSKVYLERADGNYKVKAKRKRGYLYWEKTPLKRQSANLTTEKFETTTETTTTTTTETTTGTKTETASVTPAKMTQASFIRTDSSTGSTSTNMKYGSTTGGTSTNTTVRSTSLSQEPTPTASAYLMTEEETGDDMTQSTTAHVQPDGDEITLISPELCVQDPYHEYCEIYCKPPKKFSSIPHYGNMYTKGSKQAYDCFNQVTKQWYKQVLTCDEDGKWNNTENVCSYHYSYPIYNKQLMYKFVKVSASKDRAFDKCKLENASLIKINYIQVLTVLKGNLNRFRGQYWADVRRERTLKWLTSDDQRVPQGNDVWHVSFSYIANVFRRDKCAVLDKTWLLSPTDCGENNYFICEMFIM